MHEPRVLPETVGRDDELALAAAFVQGDAPGQLLLFEGAPGVGKTTVWRAALDVAAGTNARILVGRAAEAESHLAYAVLNDLLTEIDLDALGLPSPQREALDVALLRRDAPRGSDPQAVALALTHTLRALVAATPVIVAIDDLQWVDSATADGLAFAIRRVDPGRLRVVASRRSGPRSPLEQVIPRELSRTVLLSGLSLGALRRLLAADLGFELPRRTLRQVLEVTLGNPLFALEIGRHLRRAGVPATGEALEVPQSLDDLLATKVASAEGARQALLAVALGGALTLAELRSAVPDADVDAALEGGLLVEGEDRVRPGHPLFAAAAIRQARPRELRGLHARLAVIATDDVRRLRHLAAAAEGPDARLADRLHAVAETARTSGSHPTAVELAVEALRLTPAADPRRKDRVIALGWLFLAANERARLKNHIEREFATLPPGNDRAAGHLIWAYATGDQADFEEHVTAASREATDPEVRARALAAHAIDQGSSVLRDFDAVEHEAREAMSISPGGISMYEAAHGVAWARLMRGKSMDDLRERLGTGDHPDYPYSLARMEAIQRLVRGEVDVVRRLFRAARDRAIDHGMENSRSYIEHQLCETELRGGSATAADSVIDATDPGEEFAGFLAHRARVRAVADAIRGDAAGAAAWADKTIELGEGLQTWDVVEAWRARGIAALSIDEAARARVELERVWDFTETRGIDDPGVFPAAADLVEAAHLLGETDLRDRVLGRLRTLAESQAHPWGLASLARCEGMLLAAEGDLLESASRFGAAVAAYDELGCRFEAARTLLAEGRAARRSRRWAAARTALTAAAARFDALGCTGWSANAHRLLDGLGGRRPRAAGALTPSEQRVAALAAEGRSNKDIAVALFIGVHTVEVHLARTYAKLGVQSRAQLGRALADLSGSSPP